MLLPYWPVTSALYEHLNSQTALETEV